MAPFDLGQFDASGDIRQVADDAGLMDEGGTRRMLLRDAGERRCGQRGPDAVMTPHRWTTTGDRI